MAGDVVAGTSRRQYLPGFDPGKPEREEAATKEEYPDAR
jgi:hypothetical protein